MGIKFSKCTKQRKPEQAKQGHLADRTLKKNKKLDNRDGMEPERYGKKASVLRILRKIKPKNGKISQESIKETDRISQLPDPIIHQILSYLPHKEAARTSVLSKQWRERWNSFPILEFDEISYIDMWGGFLERVKFHKYIYDSLARHDPKISIDTFRLFMFDQICPSNVNNWIRTVLKRNVKELRISFSVDFVIYPIMGAKSRSITKKILTSESLETMDLMKCDIENPVAVNLPSLKTLLLHDSNLDGRELKNVISGCPILEYLLIEDCYNLRSLEISSSHLKSLSLKHCSRLNKVNVEASGLHSFVFRGYNEYCVINLSSCKELKEITLQGSCRMMEKSCMRIFSEHPLLEKLSFSRPWKRPTERSLSIRKVKSYVELFELEISFQPHLPPFSADYLSHDWLSLSPNQLMHT